MSGKFSNQLSDAQIERLAILAEEMGEVQQVIGKILRHGYESYDPTSKLRENGPSNRDLLDKEIGHVLYAIEMLQTAGDTHGHMVTKSMAEKQRSIEKWLHHQASTWPTNHPKESTPGC